MKNQSVHEAVKERILVLDGAMGTSIQRYGLSEEDYRGSMFSAHSLPQKGNNDLLSITRPDVIREIHLRHLQAGADILSTNTFNANAVSMADYGMEEHVYEINRAAATLAKEAVNEYNNRQAPMGQNIRQAPMGQNIRQAANG